MSEETKDYKIYTYNNKHKNKVVFRSKHWINLIKNDPLYSQLFIEEEVDLDKLPSFSKDTPPPAGYADWNLWLIKVKEELRSLKNKKDLAELQLKQEKEKSELDEKQKKDELSLKDKTIKDLNKKISKEKQNYSKLQESIKSSDSQAAKFQTIIDNQKEKIKELEIAETQAKKDLTSQEKAYRELINQKDKELLIKQQEIETLKLTGKDLAADQQTLIDKHHQDITQLQELHQIELNKQIRIYDLTLDKINKVEKEIAKLTGIDYSTWELKVKLAYLKAWFINANLAATWDFIEEVYNKTFEIEEMIKGETTTSEEKTAWEKKIAIARAKTNILVIFNELKFAKKDTIEEPFIKQIIKILKDDYLDSHQQLSELQKFINNKKDLLNNPHLLKYLNEWEKLEEQTETKLPEPKDISLPSSHSTSGSGSGFQTPLESNFNSQPPTPPEFSNLEQKKEKLEDDIRKRWDYLRTFDPEDTFNQYGRNGNYWDRFWRDYLNTATLENFAEVESNLLKPLAEAVMDYLIEKGDLDKINEYQDKYQHPSELETYKDKEAKINDLKEKQQKEENKPLTLNEFMAKLKDDCETYFDWGYGNLIAPLPGEKTGGWNSNWQNIATQLKTYPVGSAKEELQKIIQQFQNKKEWELLGGKDQRQQELLQELEAISKEINQITAEFKKAEILPILDDWKYSLNDVYTNEKKEKEAVIKVIKIIADNVGNHQSQIKELDNLIKKYDYNNIELNGFLKQWKELTNYNPLWAEKDKETTKIAFTPLKYERLENGYWKVEVNSFHYGTETEFRQITFIFFPNREPIDKLIPILRKEYIAVGILLENKWKDNELVFKQLNSLILLEKEPPIITTDWTPILTELEEFFRNKPQTLQEVIDKGNKILKERGEPLAGIDLKGVEYNQLTTAAFGQNTTAIEELKTITGKFQGYNQNNFPPTFRALEAGSDGNCYLNSLSHYLTGEPNREREVAVKLRVKLILELMTNRDIMEHTYPLDETSEFNLSDGKINDENKLGWIIYKMLDNRDDIYAPIDARDNPKWELVINTRYMSTDDAKYYSQLLKRPITIIYPARGIIIYKKKEIELKDRPDIKATGGFIKLAFPDWGEPKEVNNLLHEEPWHIYRLKGGAHFVPLVRLPNHWEGRIEFVAHKIEWQKNNNDVAWYFDKAEFKDFGLNSRSKLNEFKVNEQKVLRIYFDGENENENEWYRDSILPKVQSYEDNETGEIDTKLNRKWIITICKAFTELRNEGIRVDNGEIHLNEANVEDIILAKEK